MTSHHVTSHVTAVICLLIINKKKKKRNIKSRKIDKRKRKMLVLTHIITPKPMSFEILKGPYLFWSSFFKDLFKWIFLFSNHILSPTFNPWGFLCFLLNCFFIVFCAVSIDFIASSQLLCRFVRNFSTLGNSVCTTRLLFHGCLPKLSSKGVLPVAVCLLSLYWNSAAASHSVQSSCW